MRIYNKKEVFSFLFQMPCILFYLLKKKSVSRLTELISWTIYGLQTAGLKGYSRIKAFFAFSEKGYFLCEKTLEG